MLSKLLFVWIRYYSIALVLFDVIQIHVFARPGVPNDSLCIAMDTVIRVVGAISLWSVEVIMQLRVFALYDCSRRVAATTTTLFLLSIASFLFILVHNHALRASVIAPVIALPLPGCPTVHTGIEWAQWVPATGYEGVLFVFAVVKSFESSLVLLRKDKTLPLHTILLRDNMLWFFGISGVLILNNLMVVNVTRIPWFSYAPFHAAMGIMTSRMLINLRKASVDKGSLDLDIDGTSVAVWARSGEEDSQTPLTPNPRAEPVFNFPERIVEEEMEV